MAMRYWALTACSAFAFPLSAAPLLHPMFQDHGVLQRDAPIPVYGDAPAGSEVTVTLGRAVAHARADAAGHWQLALPKMPAGGP
jgi:sialate O-acetylesterase